MTWSELLPIFIFIFLAALPGRTTFVMLIMATRSLPIPVFAGSALAFLIQSLISVFLGSLLSPLPHYWIHLGSGLLFIFFSLHMWSTRDAVENTPLADLENDRDFLTISRTAFFAVFAAEWGDVSQLAIASAAAQSSHDLWGHFWVWLMASTALLLIAAASVTIGSHAHKVLKPRVIHAISIFAFAGIGIYFLFASLRHWGQS